MLQRVPSSNVLVWMFGSLPTPYCSFTPPSPVIPFCGAPRTNLYYCCTKPVAHKRRGFPRARNLTNTKTSDLKCLLFSRTRQVLEPRVNCSGRSMIYMLFRSNGRLVCSHGSYPTAHARIWLPRRDMEPSTRPPATLVVLLARPRPSSPCIPSHRDRRSARLTCL